MIRLENKSIHTRMYLKAIRNKSFSVGLSSVRTCPYIGMVWVQEAVLNFTIPASQLLFLARLGQSVSMETAVFIPTTSLSCATCTAAYRKCEEHHSVRVLYVSGVMLLLPSPPWELAFCAWTRHFVRLLMDTINTTSQSILICQMNRWKFWVCIRGISIKRCVHKGIWYLR